MKEGSCLFKDRRGKKRLDGRKCSIVETRDYRSVSSSDWYLNMEPGSSSLLDVNADENSLMPSLGTGLNFRFFKVIHSWDCGNYFRIWLNYQKYYRVRYSNLSYLYCWHFIRYDVIWPSL